MKTMKPKRCVSSKKQYGWFYYPRLFFSVLIALPIALTLTVIRRCFLLVQKLFLRRPMIREPIHFIRSEAVKDIDDWTPEDEEKKTQEWLKAFDDDQILENARYVAEYNYHLPNEQNNEQNDLTKFPEIPYDDPLR